MDTFAQLKQEASDLNDVKALKVTLQNLLVLFEKQNQNYIQLKQKARGINPNLSITQCDAITIDPEQPGDLSMDFYELINTMKAVESEYKNM